MGVQRGSLLIADIGGYTNFLTAVELEHSTDILSDLVGAIVAQAKGAFQLAKLEGDAVFCYAPEGSTDGPAFITLVESCYFAFAERLRDIARASTCECGACKLTPSLNLKFVANHGEYVIHEVAGNSELVGQDVISVHRLLKNHVVEATGIRGYAFFSQPLVDHLDLDPAMYGLQRHVEEYDDVGEIAGLLLDLEAAWRRHQEEERVYVESGEAIFATEFDVPVSPAVMWDFLNSPSKFRLWGADDVKPLTDGPRGVGTANHCVHGNIQMVRQVLDWKPFRYVTESNKRGRFTLITTFELTSNDGGTTHVVYRARPDGGALKKALIRRVAPARMKADFEKALSLLQAQLAADATADRPAAPPGA